MADEPARLRILAGVETAVRLDEVGVIRDGRVVIKDLSWQIRPGERWGVWGPNGAGKSTVLQLLSGAITPSTGRILRAPGVRVAHVDAATPLPRVATLEALAERGSRTLTEAEQALRDEERRLASGAGDLDRYARHQEAFERVGGYEARLRVRRELARLLPLRDGATPLDQLSASERHRVALTLALSEYPDLLVLDEPTDRLDAPSRGWLVERLGRLPADVAIVIASHDRDLLGRVATCSARVEGGRLEPHRISFDDDRERRGSIRRSAAQRARREAQEARRLGAAADQARRHGSPTRAAAARNLERRAERHAVEAEVAQRRADRHADLGAHDRGPSAVPTMGRPESAASQRGPLLRARGLAAPGRFHGVDIDLGAGDKLVLVGRSGAGASTLLGMLAAEAPIPIDAEVWLRPGARLVHWDPEHRGLDERPIRRQLRSWVTDVRADGLLALVGLAADRWDATPGQLSRGQRGRAALALLLASEPDLVVLDQPEADLDLPALEQLEQALVDARTAVVLATHDLRLAAAVSTDVRSIHDGALVAWRGGVAGWRSGRRRRDVPSGPPEHVDATREAGRGAAPPTSSDVGDLEDAQAAIERLLEDPVRLSERERSRLSGRIEALVEARMQRYDDALPPPAPRYRGVEPPLTVTGDLIDDRLILSAPDWPGRPSVRIVGDVAHLVLASPPDGCWTHWARAAALRACLSLIVPIVAPTAVQTPAPSGAAHRPPPEPFVALDASWWIATREAWERWAGWH